MVKMAGGNTTKRSREVYGWDDRRQWMGRGMADVVELFAELGWEGLCGFRRVKGGAKMTKCLMFNIASQHHTALVLL